MSVKKIIFSTTISCMIWGNITAQDNTKGYYKDLFIDGGISLTSRNDLPAARYMNLAMESFICSPQDTEKNKYNYTDSLLQLQVFGGSPIDENGILLYPDGAPRFRRMYSNGGKSWRHARNVGENGNRNINDFISHGGSYVGTCAGAFLASKAVVSSGKPAYLGLYYGIWPGYTCHTGLNSESSTTVSVEKKSPLLKYADFGRDMKIDSVRHHGGGFAVVDSMYPEGTEVLARYYTLGRKLKKDIHGKPVIWAYKKSSETGRVVMCGSHPEGVETGERLDLMAAMMKYAMEGNGTPRLKAELENGKERKMHCFTHDNNPAYTAIGDKQYHHYKITVPKGTGKLTITLKPLPGYTQYDIFLFAMPKTFAYAAEAAYKNTALGCSKKLVIDNPKAGNMFISVFCNTTVGTTETAYGTQYTGRLDVLNGVPYSITATIEN